MVRRVEGLRDLLGSLINIKQEQGYVELIDRLRTRLQAKYKSLATAEEKDVRVLQGYCQGLEWAITNLPSAIQDIKRETEASVKGGPVPQGVQGSDPGSGGARKKLKRG